MSNLPLVNFSADELQAKCRFVERGDFWGCLEEHQSALVVSREYEHFLLAIGGNGGRPWQSAMPIPHPSGVFWDAHESRLIVSSTRAPNQLFCFRPVIAADYRREIVPAGLEVHDGTVFLPISSVVLPGTLYIHDVAVMNGQVYATMTGHNFLGSIDMGGGWDRVWWPRCVEEHGIEGFRQNFLQLNSIARGHCPESSFYTAFSDSTTGPKPWKAGYGPRGKGVVFSGATRDVLCRGLTCPHSAKLRGEQLWLCNSGYGGVGYIDPRATTPAFTTVGSANGFTRGLAFLGDNCVVAGLSRVIEKYEPYAPGLDPAGTVCGLVIIETDSGTEIGRLEWPDGYQIYDIQVLPNTSRPLFPYANEVDGSSRFLHYIG